MNKESIFYTLATKPCGHIDQKAIDVYRSEADAFEYDETHYRLVREIVPWALDGLEEDMTEEEIKAHIAKEWVDYVWYPEGPTDEEPLKSCAECDQEKLRRWIESVQDLQPT